METLNSSVVTRTLWVPEISNSNWNSPQPQVRICTPSFFLSGILCSFRGEDHYLVINMAKAALVMSEYELERLERIRENEKMLQELFPAGTETFFEEDKKYSVKRRLEVSVNSEETESPASDCPFTSNSAGRLKGRNLRYVSLDRVQIVSIETSVGLLNISNKKKLNVDGVGHIGVVFLACRCPSNRISTSSLESATKCRIRYRIILPD